MPWEIKTGNNSLLCVWSLGGFAGWFWLRGSPEGGLPLLSCSQGSPSVEALAPKALAPGPVAWPWTCDCCHVLLVTQISSNTMQKGSICYSFSFGKRESDSQVELRGVSPNRAGSKRQGPWDSMLPRAWGVGMSGLPPVHRVILLLYSLLPHFPVWCWL